MTKSTNVLLAGILLSLVTLIAINANRALHPVTWRYRELDEKAWGFVKDLVSEGEDGWELVAIYRDKDNKNRAIIKRPSPPWPNNDLPPSRWLVWW